MLNIEDGINPRAQKVAIYGSEGVGKTSLAARTPEALFIDTEGGTSHMDVRRINKPPSWEEFLSIIREIAATPGICKTLVIDTADWAEQMIASYLCEKYNQKSIENFGYGKGYTYMAEEFARFLAACDQVIAAGIHVVIIAHAKMRKFEQPDEMGAYDRWELKLSKQCAPLLKEWCDHLLFCNYQTIVVTSDNNTKKPQGGKRVIYTTHHPAWDAKTRADLPEIIDLDYRNIAKIFQTHPAASTGSKTAFENERAMENLRQNPEVNNHGTPLDRLRRCMDKDNISEAALQQLVASKGHYPADTPVSGYSERFITEWCLKYWNKILKIINAAPNGLTINKEDK